MEHDYTEISKVLNLNSLETSRNYHDIIYLYKIINDNVQLLNLKNKFEDYDPNKELRNRHLIYRINKKYNKVKNKSLICKLSSLANKHSRWINLKTESITVFRNLINVNNNVDKKINIFYKIYFL